MTEESKSVHGLKNTEFPLDKEGRTMHMGANKDEGMNSIYK